MDFYLNPENSLARLKREMAMHGALVVAYDFDNTVYDCHKKGWNFNLVIDLLWELKRLGCYLIIFTANEDQTFIKKYCEETEIPYDSINENPPFYQSAARKIYYNVLLDDRAGLAESYHTLKKLIQYLKNQ